jgi:CheY-like chemotaxis protein
MASSTQYPFVLVVDDNSESADLMVELLQACGMNSAAAYSGAAGLDAVINFRPDVVLLDLLMPQMDGFEVANAIRKSSRPDKPALIAFSALTDPGTIELAMKSGFHFHLPKPATIKQVLTVVGNARALKSAKERDNAQRTGAPGAEQVPAQPAHGFTVPSGFKDTH